MTGTGTGHRVDPPRRAAFDVLRAVAQRDSYANLLLPAVLTARGISGRDAAFATELTYGTLRGRGTYDAVLEVCSDRPVGRIDAELREVLRLGAHQLLATRIPAHAAVAASVDLAKDVAGQRQAGFVNAVLRRVATRDMAAWLDIVAPDRSGDPAGYLAIRYSHPRWIVAAVAAALGEQPSGGLSQTEAMLAADNVRPQVTLLAKPGQLAPAELAAAGAISARWSPFGAYLPDGHPAALQAVADGSAAVQDEASQLAAIALAGAPLTGPDRCWLDLCAGPGGKASILAGLAAARGARLLAADIQPHRAALARAAMAGRARGGQTAGQPEVAGAAGKGGWVVVADGTVPPWRPGTFDRVLADVPCSGLGALRRRPEARWRRTPRDVAALGPLQRRLLATALRSLRPGGVAAYVTCSPHLDETRRVVEQVIGRTPGISVLDAPAVLADVPGLRCAAGPGEPAHPAAGPGGVRPGGVGPGDVRPGDVRPGDVRPGDVRPGDVRPGGVGPGGVRPGEARPGDVGPGDVRPGEARPGDPRRGGAVRGDAEAGGAGRGDGGSGGLARDAVPGNAGAGAYAQFWPHRHGTDAIFVALLRRDW